MNVPDNLALFMEHEREQERKLASRPKCSWCTNPIQDDECFELGCELVCVSCIEDCKRLTENYIE